MLKIITSLTILFSLFFSSFYTTNASLNIDPSVNPFMILTGDVTNAGIDQAGQIFSSPIGILIIFVLGISMVLFIVGIVLYMITLSRNNSK